MDKGIKFLSVSAVIFKVLAWVSAAFFLIVSIIVLFGAGGPDAPRIASLIFLLGGALYFLILLSAAEALKLLISLHEKASGAENFESKTLIDSIQVIGKKVDRVLVLLEGKPAGK
jgi:hypothetical protein